MFILSLIIAAVPFIFGLVRAVTTGSDYRYLWLACASLVGAAVIRATVRSPDRRKGGLLRITLVTFLVSSLCAGAAALVLGARSGLSVLIVAAGFGACQAISGALRALSRTPQSKEDDL